MAQPLTERQMLLRTVPMPADTNANGDIFGGWIMSQMDLAGGILAKKASRGRTVTVAVDEMVFHKPVQVGDVVCCYGYVQKTGRTSVTVALEVWVNPILRDDDSERMQVTSAHFTYVCIDDDGRKRPLPEELQGLVTVAAPPGPPEDR